jgi:hypothetical protein
MSAGTLTVASGSAPRLLHWISLNHSRVQFPSGYPPPLLLLALALALDWVKARARARARARAGTDYSSAYRFEPAAWFAKGQRSVHFDQPRKTNTPAARVPRP